MVSGESECGVCVNLAAYSSEEKGPKCCLAIATETLYVVVLVVFGSTRGFLPPQFHFNLTTDELRRLTRS